MTDLALVTANRLHIVESLEQMTQPLGETITLGQAARLDVTTGKFTKANATTATEKKAYGLLVGKDGAGAAGTALRKGVVSGYDLSALDYGAKVYLSDADGMLADTPGTIERHVATVIPVFSQTLGNPADKLLLVDFGEGEKSQTLVVSAELLAASVDKFVFMADRPYQVTAVKEIHSVVGGASAAVRPRKITAAATDAPGATAGTTVKELTTAAIDLTATINTTQTPALSATAADLLLATGDKLALDFSGTLTGLVGAIFIHLKAL
jgi:hypothetical protein